MLRVTKRLLVLMESGQSRSLALLPSTPLRDGERSRTVGMTSPAFFHQLASPGLVHLTWIPLIYCLPGEINATSLSRSKRVRGKAAKTMGRGAAWGNL
jgi:hypothetical protein